MAQITEFLKFCAMTGNVDEASTLIINGANINATYQGKTILDLAFDNGHVEMVKLLITNSAKSGSAASLDLVFEMLTKDIASNNGADEHQMTKLHWAVVAGHMPQLRMLVEKGANVNAMDANGYTPLHWTVLARHGEGAADLIEMGANINAMEKQGWTALHWAVAAGYRDVVEMLIERGADINAKDEIGRAAILCAASDLNFDLVRLLQHRGADCNARDNKGRGLKGYLKVGSIIRNGIEIGTVLGSIVICLS
jgi:ankyrin repeat protein